VPLLKLRTEASGDEDEVPAEDGTRYTSAEELDASVPWHGLD
jgi:hypothetical protein